MRTGFAIETSELTKVFGNLVAVDRLNLQVPAGSIFGLLGPNGAGKTTTFSMICGFVKPTSGSATVLGYPVNQFPWPSGLLAALPQDAKFHPDRTVMDSMVFLGTLTGMTREESASQASELLERVDLLNVGNKKGAHLSHGMAKRFGIAQAFLGHPELVLLDEPTAGLDPRNAYTIRQMVRALAGSATVIVSSHNLVEVQDLCTHAAIISQGRLVSSGSMDSLTSRNQQVVLTIMNMTVPMVEAIGALPGVEGVVPAENGTDLKVVYVTSAGLQPDEAVSQIIAGAMAAGATVSGVKRGQDLEERYREVT